MKTLIISGTYENNGKGNYDYDLCLFGADKGATTIRISFKTNTVMKNYTVTYHNNTNGHEISKPITAITEEEAIKDAEDVVMWPIEFHKNYNEMEIVLTDESGEIVYSNTK